MYRQLRKPRHLHGKYNDPRMGVVDEAEAIKDYGVLIPTLQDPRSRKKVAEIQGEERVHKAELKQVIEWEKEAAAQKE